MEEIKTGELAPLQKFPTLRFSELSSLVRRIAIAPIGHACDAKRWNVVEYLASIGANVNVRDSQG